MKETAEVQGGKKGAVTSGGVGKCWSNKKENKEAEMPKDKASDILCFSDCQQIPQNDGN